MDGFLLSSRSCNFDQATTEGTYAPARKNSLEHRLDALNTIPQCSKQRFWRLENGFFADSRSIPQVIQKWKLDSFCTMVFRCYRCSMQILHECLPWYFAWILPQLSLGKSLQLQRAGAGGNAGRDTATTPILALRHRVPATRYQQFIMVYEVHGVYTPRLVRFRKPTITVKT